LEINVKKLFIAAVLAGALPAASAAPRAESALECGIAADMAVVAHSLAHEQVQRAKADAIMVRIYDVAASARGMELMNDILETAYLKKDDAAPAQKFAEELFATCLKAGGNMDTILGKRL
jgi:poly-gamma-glutamate capsule biosynthesis protein CapA/YwtB (metallophosphatase superfamily)